MRKISAGSLNPLLPQTGPSIFKVKNQIRSYSAQDSPPSRPIIRIKHATFYRHHPNSFQVTSKNNPPLFKETNFSLHSFKKKRQSEKREYWAIIGPSSAGKTTFLQMLRGGLVCIPATARSYPYLSSEEIERKDPNLRTPSKAIRYVGFDGEQGLGRQAPKSAYLSARYESRREDTDFSVRDYLQGHTELNPSTPIENTALDQANLERVIKDLGLGELIDMPVSNLSNGQTRRARIARALLEKPEVLLLDEPFQGLDPPTLLTLSPMLHALAKSSNPRLVLSLRPQDPIPNWITCLVYLKGNCQIALRGYKPVVLKKIRNIVRYHGTKNDLQLDLSSLSEIGRKLTPDGIQEANVKMGERPIFESAVKTDPESPLSRDGYELNDTKTKETGEALVEMEGVHVKYGTKSVLGNWTQDVAGVKTDGLWWTVKRGERWGIFGPNGSGKTTLLSLICSDHPQTYSLPIRLFGKSRLPEPGQPGISIFDLQSKIGHSSPEIHNHIPRNLTLRKVLANAWADTFMGVPKLDENANERIDACLRWFEQDLKPAGVVKQDDEGQYSDNGFAWVKQDCEEQTLDHAKLLATIKPTWADDILFREIPFSAQRVALFLRAIIKSPDLVILDEAFSGMDDGLRDRCLLFLAHGEAKQYSQNAQNKQIIESYISKLGQIKVGGLNPEQALLCISHVKEEIPGSVREWICLPEANTGKEARFGKLDGPIEGNWKRWGDIWGLSD